MNDLKDGLCFLCWSWIDFQSKDQLNLTHLQRKNKGGKLDYCQATHCQEIPVLLRSHKRPPCISVASVYQFGALSLTLPVQISLCRASRLMDIHRRKWPFYEKKREDTDAQREEQNKFFLCMSLNDTFIALNDVFIFHLLFFFFYYSTSEQKTCFELGKWTLIWGTYPLKYS